MPGLSGNSGIRTGAGDIGLLKKSKVWRAAKGQGRLKPGPPQFLTPTSCGKVMPLKTQDSEAGTRVAFVI